jgi:hypothetical protein
LTSRLKSAAHVLSSSVEDSVVALLVAVEAWVDKVLGVVSSHAAEAVLLVVLEAVLPLRHECDDDRSCLSFPFSYFFPAIRYT